MEFALFDVLTNLPNTFLYFYYNSKANDLKKNRLYLLMGTIMTSAVVYLNDINVISKAARMYMNVLLSVFLVLFFKRAISAVVFSALNYVVLVLLECLCVLVGYVSLGSHIEVVMSNKVFAVEFKIFFLLCYIVTMYLLCTIWKKTIKRSIEMFIPLCVVQLLFVLVLFLQFLESSQNAVAGIIACFFVLWEDFLM